MIHEETIPPLSCRTRLSREREGSTLLSTISTQ